MENGTDSNPVTRTVSGAKDGGMFDEKPGWIGAAGWERAEGAQVGGYEVTEGVETIEPSGPMRPAEGESKAAFRASGGKNGAQVEIFGNEGDAVVVNAKESMERATAEGAAGRAALEVTEDRRCLFGATQQVPPMASNAADPAERGVVDDMPRNVEDGAARAAVNGAAANAASGEVWHAIRAGAAAEIAGTCAMEIPTGGAVERATRSSVEAAGSGWARRGRRWQAERCRGAGGHLRWVPVIGARGGDDRGNGKRMTDRAGAVPRGAGSYQRHHPQGGARDRSAAWSSPVQDCSCTVEFPVNPVCAVWKWGCDMTQKVRGIWGNLTRSTRKVVWGQERVEKCSRTENYAEMVRRGEMQALNQMVNDVDISGVSKGICRVDDRSRIEHLLVMGGVEKNPGPGPDWERDGSLTTLTHENALWVFDSAAWTSKTDKYQDRVRALLREFKPGSVAFRRIAKCAFRRSSLTRRKSK